LSGSSLEHGQFASRDGASFLVDVPRVFENVAGNRIKRELERLKGGEVLLQHQEKLDEGRHFSIWPDIVLQQSARVVAVADIQYKLPLSKNIASADVYQALTYATRYGLDRCTLFYAEMPDISKGVIKGVTVNFVFVDFF